MNTAASYNDLVNIMAKRLTEAAGHLPLKTGRMSIWIRFVALEEMDGSQVEQTRGTTTRMVMEVSEPEQLIHVLAENIALKVFGEEVRMTDGIPELVIKLFDNKFWLAPEGPYADTDTGLKLKVTVYQHHPGLFETLFGRKKTSEVSE